MKRFLLIVTGVAAAAWFIKTVVDNEEEKNEALARRLNAALIRQEADAVTDSKGVRWARHNGGLYPINP